MTPNEWITIFVFIYTTYYCFRISQLTPSAAYCLLIDIYENSAIIMKK